MGHENDPVLIYTTFENVEAAKQVGRALVEARLAACVNIFPSMTAIYEWQGALEESGEAVMIIKTRKGCQRQALQRAKDMHPYDKPALLVIDPVEVDKDFAAWIAEQTNASLPKRL